MSQTQDYDTAGRPTTLTYQGPVTHPDGTTGTGTWIAWTQARNTAGQITAETTPDGILLAGAADTGDPAAAYERQYAYDQASRLTQVTDRTAPAGETINTDPVEGALTPTTTRAYTFDKNGNRTQLATTVGTATPTTRTWTYDAADRIGHNQGYVYDGLGRQTALPATDAPGTDTQTAGTGNITLGYYADDTAHTITRGTHTTTLGTDPDGRRLTLDSTANGIHTKHYTDTSDNPAWTSQTIGTTTTTTRYETTLGGDLALTIEDGTAKLAINNPHGDTVATTTLPTTGNTTGIDAWAQYDEYGNQQTNPIDTGTTTYAWHGADQRATETSGLILMGARLYNSISGHFTTRDPVAGGNTTTYTYPQDPVNSHDVSGLFAPLAWLGWMVVRWVVTQGIRYYAKKRLFKAANIARAAIRNNHTRALAPRWYSNRTTDLAGRIFTGKRATYTANHGRVSLNGQRAYRSGAKKSGGENRANFSKYQKRPVGSKTSKFPNRYANYHVNVWPRRR